MDVKPKIGAPSKGLEGKQQVTVSVPKKIVAELGIETIRKVSTNIINIAYNKALEQKNKSNA